MGTEARLLRNPDRPCQQQSLRDHGPEGLRSDRQLIPTGSETAMDTRTIAIVALVLVIILALIPALTGARARQSAGFHDVWPG